MERLRNIFKNLRKYASFDTFKLSIRKKKKFRN